MWILPVVRRAVLIGSALLAAAAPAASATPTDTVLKVSLELDGRSRSWALSCEPPRGTLPERDAACASLARLGDVTAAPQSPQVCVTGSPAWLGGVSLRGRIHGVPIRQLVAANYRCWGQTSAYGLARALGLGPHLLAARSQSRG